MVEDLGFGKLSAKSGSHAMKRGKWEEEARSVQERLMMLFVWWGSSALLVAWRGVCRGSLALT